MFMKLVKSASTSMHVDSLLARNITLEKKLTVKIQGEGDIPMSSMYKRFFIHNKMIASSTSALQHFAFREK